MSIGEICQEYRLAKNKKKQIGIIADQNPQYTREDIIRILQDNGLIEKKEPEKKLPEFVYSALYDRMEKLDREIKKLESEYKQIAEFLKGESA